MEYFKWDNLSTLKTFNINKQFIFISKIIEDYNL